MNMRNGIRTPAGDWAMLHPPGSGMRKSNKPFPRIDLDLDGPDGNIFVVLGHAQEALRDTGSSEERVKQFVATIIKAGSYKAALTEITRWVAMSQRMRDYVDAL